MSPNKLNLQAFLPTALFILPVVTGAMLLAAHSSSQAKTTPPTSPRTEVTVAPVIDRPLHEWQEFSGRLEAVDRVEVRPRVNGYIDRVVFADGARVKKGQLLFQIDPRPFQADVDRLTSERARALSDLDLAKANHARADRLIEANAISHEEYDRLAAAQTSAEGALGSVTGSLTAARLNLEFTQVRAPIDGHVSRALITAGNLVTGDNVLTTVVSDDPVYAYFDADEQTYLRYRNLDSGSSKSASEVFMGLVDEDGYPHQGELDFVDNRVDPSTGTIRARAVFANPDGRYTPGLFARVRVIGGADRDTVLIDERAVGTDLGKKFVYLLEPGNKVESRFIELGPQIDGLRVVRTGLSAGDVIVINGLQHVKPGQVVNPMRVAMGGHKDGLEEVAGTADPTSIASSAANDGSIHSQR